MSLIPLPKLEDLPLNEGEPPNSCWGLWSKNGFDDQLGSLNYLTNAHVLKSMKTEVVTGERVGLNLPLDLVNPPLFGRAKFSRQMIRKDYGVINDDVITFNTQSSSQWDSFRHFAYQDYGKFYNGVTQEDIHSDSASSPVNGIGAWASRCIAGRAVLIDYASYAEANSIKYNVFEQYGIPLEDIKKIASVSGVQFQPGDILLLRTGYVKAYKIASKETREQAAVLPSQFCGLGQGPETTQWLWDRQFAAVASDSPAFECYPPLKPENFLHPILLAGWGTPIGELFDLEGLAELCKKNKKWSFFLSSAPLNYAGAVASPPNAIAFF